MGEVCVLLNTHNSSLNNVQTTSKIYTIDEDNTDATDINFASDIADITKFDNSAGNNNCWLNSVMRVLAYMLKLVPEDHLDYQSQNPIVNSFTLYLKDTINTKKGGILCFDDQNIFVAGDHQFQSMKRIFSQIIGDPIFDTAQQQDTGEALGRILDTVPLFSFCQYESFYQYTCGRCADAFISNVVPDYIIPVAIRQSPSSQERSLYNTGNAIMATLNDSVPIHDRSCTNCDSTNISQKLEMVTLPEFLIVQLLLFDNDRNKIPHTCLPSPEIHMSALGDGQNYKLQCIIEHLGTQITNGHYVCYFLKNQRWYRASDLQIDVVNIEELPVQPYICIYRKI